MFNEFRTFETEVAGRKLVIETGKISWFLSPSGEKYDQGIWACKLGYFVSNSNGCVAAAAVEPFNAIIESCAEYEPSSQITPSDPFPSQLNEVGSLFFPSLEIIFPV